MSKRAKVLILPLLILFPLLWALFLYTRAPQAIDFYPLYFAAQRILAGQSPYGIQANLDLAQHWQTPFAAYAQAGIAYPLPLILLVIPLSFLPFPFAACFWTTIGFVCAYLCVLISRRQSAAKNHPTSYQWLSLLLPLTFFPLFRTVELGQATLLWFGLAVLLLLSLRNNHIILAALCIVLLLLKPQNGLLFAAYGLYWLVRHRRKGLLYVAAFGGLLLGLSLAIQPQWISAWLQQVETYRTVVQPPSLLPLGLILLVVFWRFDLWVIVAVAQVMLFPMSDVYSTLPLLLAWCAFAPPLALLGSAISWLWLFVPVPTPLSLFWLLIFAPLMLAVLWQTRPAQLRRRQKQSIASPTVLQNTTSM